MLKLKVTYFYLLGAFFSELKIMFLAEDMTFISRVSTWNFHVKECVLPWKWAQACRSIPNAFIVEKYQIKGCAGFQIHSHSNRAKIPDFQCRISLFVYSPSFIIENVLYVLHSDIKTCYVNSDILNFRYLYYNCKMCVSPSVCLYTFFWNMRKDRNVILF